jgi:hypothetical protein
LILFHGEEYFLKITGGIAFSAAAGRKLGERAD